MYLHIVIDEKQNSKIKIMTRTNNIRCIKMLIDHTLSIWSSSVEYYLLIL